MKAHSVKYLEWESTKMGHKAGIFTAWCHADNSGWTLEIEHGSYATFHRGLPSLEAAKAKAQEILLVS